MPFGVKNGGQQLCWDDVALENSVGRHTFSSLQHYTAEIVTRWMQIAGYTNPRLLLLVQSITMEQSWHAWYPCLGLL
jgi:hypothetical protein